MGDEDDADDEDDEGVIGADEAGKVMMRVLKGKPVTRQGGRLSGFGCG